MRLSVSGKDYFVQWRHITGPDAVGDYLRHSAKVRYSAAELYGMVTLCDIRLVGDLLPAEDGKEPRREYTTLCTGESICRIDDMYDKPEHGLEVKAIGDKVHIILSDPDEMKPLPLPKLKYVGRKRSLEKALFDANFVEADRKAFWDVFLASWPPLKK